MDDIRYVSLYTVLYMEKNFDEHEITLSRRSFLKFFATATAAFVGSHFLDKSFRLATNAAFERGSESLPKLSAVEHEPSENVKKKMWEKHFNSEQPNFMSYDAWNRLSDSFNNIINLHFNANGPELSYDEYFEWYIDQISRICKKHELDLDIFLISMEYSGRQIINDPANYRSDILVGIGQDIGGALADHYRIDSEFADHVGAEALGMKSVEFGGQFPLNYAGAMRMLSANITTGIMDYELSEKAYQFLSQLTEGELDAFAQKYHELYVSFVLLSKSYFELDKLRNKFEKDLVALIPLLRGAFDLFFHEDTSEKAYSQIGLGVEPDSWQKVQPTKLWERLFYRRAKDMSPEVMEQALSSVKLEFHELYAADKQTAYYQLLRDQIFNPKLVSFLEMYGVDNGTITSIKDSLDSIALKKRECKQNLYAAQSSEAPYEFDVGYQLQSAVLLTKAHLALAEAHFGDFERKNKNEIMLYAFIMSEIREASQARFILSSKFGLDFTIDAPYAREEVLKNLQPYIMDLTKIVQNPIDQINVLQTKYLESVSAPQHLIYASQYWSWDSTVNWGNGVYLRGKTQFEQ